jgi:hypothetical protein
MLQFNILSFHVPIRFPFGPASAQFKLFGCIALIGITGRFGQQIRAQNDDI